MAAPTDLAASVSGANVALAWTDTVSDNTDYSVERADLTAHGAFAEIATVGNGTTHAYTDVGPFTAKHRYGYRVKVVGGALAGQYTNQVSIFTDRNHAGRLRRSRYR